MRRLVLTTLAVSLAATLSACGKSETQSQDQGAQATSSAQPAAPQAALSPEEIQKAQASLPAPYDTADLKNGEAKFALCASCHTIAPGGANLTGPHLHDVVGRKAGSVENYNYTDALKNSGVVWDAATLEPWLTNPRAMVPGTKMSFVGMRDAKDRTDLIAYLMVNSAPKSQ